MRSSKRNSQRGSVLVEFALSSTLLLLLFFGIVDFARLFTTAQVVMDAATAGTQYGALSPAHWGDFDGIHANALASAQNPADMTVTPSQFCTCSIGGPQISCPATCPGGTAATYLRVDVTEPFSTTIAYPGLPSVMTVTRTSIVRLE